MQKNTAKLIDHEDVKIHMIEIATQGVESTWKTNIGGGRAYAERAINALLNAGYVITKQNGE